MSKSGRWVTSPTAQGASQAHSFFGRPSKAAANSPLAAQGGAHQPYQQSNSHGPITAGWNNSSSAPNGTAQQAQHASGTGSMPSTSSAPLAAPQAQSRWQGFTRMFRPRPQLHRHGSGALLDNADPAVLGSIPESDPGTGVVDASLLAYQSTDLDASSAAATANKLWAITAPSLSPRRSAAASQGSGQQSGPSQGSYVVPSPWTTPVKQLGSSSASPASGSYPVPSPQNTPLGTPLQPRVQTPPPSVGPFEAAARARAAQARASGSSPRTRTSSTGSIVPKSSGQASYPVPSPSTSTGPQQSVASEISPAASVTKASSQASGTPNRPKTSSLDDWTTGISGMGTTRAARPSPSAGSRRKRL